MLNEPVCIVLKEPGFGAEVVRHCGERVLNEPGNVAEPKWSDEGARE